MNQKSASAKPLTDWLTETDEERKQIVYEGALQMLKAGWGFRVSNHQLEGSPTEKSALERSQPER